MPLDGYASGLLVESREGRPIKIEANPEHPSTLGGTSLFQQASILQLYDDWRGRRVRRGSEPSSWEDLFAALRVPRSDHGAGLRILMEPTASPLVLHLLERVRVRFPKHASPFILRFGTKGTSSRPGWRSGDRCCLSSISLGPTPSWRSITIFSPALPFSVRYARQWARRRRLASPHDPTTRLYVAESLLERDRIRWPTIGCAARPRGSRRRAGTRRRAADHRASLFLGAPPRAGSRSGRLGAGGRGRPAQPSPGDHGNSGRRPSVRGRASAGVRNECRARQRRSHHHVHRSRAPVAGRRLPNAGRAGARDAGGPGRHAARAGRKSDLHGACRFGLRGGSRPGRRDSLPRPLRERDRRGLPLVRPRSALPRKLGRRARLRRDDSHDPASVSPLVDARTSGELLAALAGEATPDAHRLLHGYWTGVETLSELAWQESIRLGLQRDTAYPSVAPGAVDANAVSKVLEPVVTAAKNRPPDLAGTIEVDLYPSPTVHDGRFANNAWLQEHPTPIDEAHLGQRRARQPGHRRGGSASRASRRGRARRTATATVRAPVLVAPGLADGVAALWLGYGRRGAGGCRARRRGATPTRCARGRRLHAIARCTGPRAPRELPAGADAGALVDTKDRPIALGRRSTNIAAIPTSPPSTRAPADSLCRSTAPRATQWAHDDRSRRLHGLQRLRRRLPGREQHPVVGKEQRAASSREMHWLRIDTLLQRRARRAAARCTSRCSASTARRRPASTSARSTPRCTAPTG